jgi:hypothetical protein
MKEGPRPKTEGIIELKSVMTIGIVIQSFLLTAILLFCYMQGLFWRTGDYFGSELETDSNGRITFTNGFLEWAAENHPDVRQIDDIEELLDEGVRAAQTMAIVAITFGELLRAYSCRALRESVFTIGFFSNKYMQYSVGLSVVCTLLIVAIPWGLRDAFGCASMEWREWILVLSVSVVPFIVDELTKCVYRYTGFGLRPKVDRSSAGKKNSSKTLLRGVDGDSADDPEGKKASKEAKEVLQTNEVIAHEGVSIAFHAENGDNDADIDAVEPAVEHAIEPIAEEEPAVVAVDQAVGPIAEEQPIAEEEPAMVAVDTRAFELIDEDEE